MININVMSLSSVCSNEGMLDRSHQTWRHECVALDSTMQQIVRRQGFFDNSPKRARFLLPTIPAVISHAIHEARRESSDLVPLDSGELARDARRKERFSGER